MISIAVVDDEQAFRDTMDVYLMRYQQEHQQQFQVDHFPDGLDIADSY